MSTVDTERDLVSPTGRIVTVADPGTPEWFEGRRGGITGTDLPKILGDTKYGNALKVWLDKRDELPGEDEAGEAAEWGHLLEDPVAREWARRQGVTVARIGVISNTDEPWMRASLDRLVYDCPDAAEGLCGLEVKTRSAFKAGSFREDVPDDVLAQVAWGRRVSGLHHMHIAVLVGGQQLLDFRYDQDDELENFLIEQARPVWEGVESGDPPIVAPDSEGVLLDLLNLMYSNREGERDVDPDTARTWLAQYEAGVELENEGKALKEQAKTGLVELLEDGDVGKVDGTVAYTYKRPAPSAKMKAPDLRRLQKEDPDTYARLLEDGYIVVSQDGPRFNRK